MALVGYTRVSSVGQTLDVQQDKLAYCDKIFQKKISGVNDKRPQLQACLDYVRQEDTLVVTKLDRLVRHSSSDWRVNCRIHHSGRPISFGFGLCHYCCYNLVDPTLARLS
jgi:predicted site-specific integrase-resolvase